MQTKEEIIEFEQEVEHYKSQLKKGQYALMLSILAWGIVLVLFFFVTPDFTVPLGIAFAVGAISGIYGITKVVNYSDMPVYLGVICAFCMLSVPFIPQLYGIYTASAANKFYKGKTAEKWRVFYENSEQPNADNLASTSTDTQKITDDTADINADSGIDSGILDAKKRFHASRSKKKTVMLGDEAEMKKTIANFFDHDSTGEENAINNTDSNASTDLSTTSGSVDLNKLSDSDDDSDIMIGDFDSMIGMTDHDDATVEVNVASSRNHKNLTDSVIDDPIEPIDASEIIGTDNLENFDNTSHSTNEEKGELIFPMVNMIIDQPKTDGSILGISYRAHDGISQELSSRIVKSVHAVQQNHFVVNYMAESNNELEFLRKSSLLQRNIGLSEVHKQAITNLNEITENGNKAELHGELESGVLGLTFGADLESALMLVDDLWDKRLKDLYNGNYAVAVLAKNMVFIVDWQNKEAVSHINEIIPKMKEDGIRILSDHLFKRHNKRWYLIA